MFRPQVGHHQTNTERITGTTKCALNGTPFGETLSAEKDMGTTLQYRKSYVLVLIKVAGLTSYKFDRGHPVV